MENKNDPLVTVLMSVYNNEGSVSRAISSILNQSFKDFEFLVINDGSTDNTAGIINSFNDSRIRIINNKSNLGLTRSLNKGLKKAKGKYIARIDADDFSFPERLEKQITFLESNQDFVLLGTSFNIVNNDGKIIKEVIFNTPPEKLYYDLIFQNMFAHSSVVFRLREVDNLDGYSGDLKYAQDYDLWCKLSRVGKIWVLPDLLTLWCDDPLNISNIKRKEQDLISEGIFINNLRLFNVEENVIEDSYLLHNYYDDNFTNCPEEKIHNTFKALLYINNKIVNNCPDFYSKSELRKIGYKNLIDLLTRIYKYTNNKFRVLSFLAKNCFNLRLDIEAFKKVINSKLKIKGNNNA